MVIECSDVDIEPWLRGQFYNMTGQRYLRFLRVSRHLTPSVRSVIVAKKKAVTRDVLDRICGTLSARMFSPYAVMGILTYIRSRNMSLRKWSRTALAKTAAAFGIAYLKTPLPENPDVSLSGCS